MTERLTIAGNVVQKRLRDRHEAIRLVARTEALIAAGVPTPTVAVDDAEATVTMARIEGEGGLTAIAREGAPALRRVLQPLTTLHPVQLPDLPIFDPVVKIAGRLARSPNAAISAIMEDALRHVGKGGKASTIHGDFHARQVILDGKGRGWVLDLDDLAAGPPEADLGNFAAHLATRSETALEFPGASFAYWLEVTLNTFEEWGPIDHALAEAHGRLALVRRALKLAEAGDHSVLRALAEQGQPQVRRPYFPMR